MRATVLLLLVVGAAAGAARKGLRMGLRMPPPPPPGPGARVVTEAWFKQRQDHLERSNINYWYQRYFTNGQFYSEGGPVFLFIEGEGEASPGWLQGGHMFELAREAGAYMVSLEHRYYGNSSVVSGDDVSGLRFLSAAQGLADLASFISAVPDLPGLSSLRGARWIAFGCSYPGNLAAWLRLTHPHLVHAAVASSAPVRAQADFPEYLQVVERVVRDTAPGCLDTLEQATHEIFRLREEGDWDQLRDLFGSAAGDVEQRMANELMGRVQYNSKSSSLGWRRPMDETCDTLTDSALGGPLQRYAAAWKSLASGWERRRYSAGVAWVYQTCTEFGYQMTARNASRFPFYTIGLADSAEICNDFYGSKFTLEVMEAGVLSTNIAYGGSQPVLSNVVFANGGGDPWAPLGVAGTLSPDVTAITIDGEPHCTDFQSAVSADSAALTAARAQIAELVAGWVAQ